VNNALGKGTNAYPSFIADSHRESTDYKECTVVKHNHITNKQIRRQSSPLDAFFSSIAERTRSQSKCDYSALVSPKVTKRAKRQLNKLEITMNTFKSYQTNLPNRRGMKNEDRFHETSRKQGIVSENKVKRDNGKRKRPQKQPRSESKKQCHNDSNYQHPREADRTLISNSSRNEEIKPNSEVEDEENDRNLSKSEGELDKNEVHLDKSDGELDSSDGNKSEFEIEKGQDERVFGTTEGEFDTENGEKELNRNEEDRSECKHKEKDELSKTKENENDENRQENYGKELGKDEDGKDRCERGLDKDGDESKVGEMLEEDKIKGELDQSKEYKSEGELDSEEDEDVASTTDPKPPSISAKVR